jgi:hypothetical protein
VVIVGSYRWGGISAAELDASGKGLSAAARAAISRPMEATALEFHVPGKDALGALRLAQQLSGALVQRVDGVLVDGETHELFSLEAWKALRMSWVGPLPAVITQIALRKNGGDATTHRLVTFGMAKFGLPDITVTDPPGAAGPPAATRIHLLCQLMVEGHLPAVDGTMTLNALLVRERATKKALLDAQLGGPQFVRLRKTNAQAGDPDNRLVEMLPAP